ncbi:hypothetical protein KVR01_000499 [Diaporthe batatas]|uniref:uncharacterized protein n=1 Tax=Diaporthe batatas TaxID=748121 RepID=UPI001D050A3E|nr:uncharacterized protein KVR01_000499 [Diaporthe batatas]KAG8169754.1 hypothetical protein KVR01_000499 [Diaporthe batatas]
MTRDEDKRAGIVVDPEADLAHVPPAVTRHASFNDSPTIRGAPPMESGWYESPRNSVFGDRRYNRRGVSGRTTYPAYRFSTQSAPAMPPTGISPPPANIGAKDEVYITLSEEECDMPTRRRYITKLCRATLVYGSPTHRIVPYIQMAARALDMDIYILYVPDNIIVAFDSPDESNSKGIYQPTEVKLIQGAGTHVGKMLDAHEVYKHVLHGRMSVSEGIQRLDDIERRNDEHNVWFMFMIFGFAAVGIAPFAYRARFIDLPVAFITGSLLGVMQLKFAPSHPLYALIFEVTAAIIMSFLGRMFGSIRGADGDRIFCYSALTQCSINLLMPGYWMTNAALEIMSKNIVTGGSRMMYALIYSLLLAYGIAIGSTLYGYMDYDAVSNPRCENLIDRRWNLFFVPFFSVQVSIISGAKYRQIPAMVFISFMGYLVNFLSVDVFHGSFTIAHTLGGFMIGLLGNLYSKFGWQVEHIIYDRGFSRGNNAGRRRSRISLGASQGFALAAAGMVPAMIVQVPSGLANTGIVAAGLQTADAIVRNTTANNMAFPLGELQLDAMPILLQVIQIGISIAMGLSLAALMLYPLAKKRSGVMAW